MSVRRLAAIQPESFAFTPENLDWARGQIARFPAGRQASAVIALLWRAQEQHEFWLPRPAIEYVADLLDMPRIRVLEVATFYTMFNLEPVGRYFIQLCGTTPCRLRGAQDIIAVCQERIGPQRRITDDGLFSWLEVECLGACCNAPMVQINKVYYEDLTPISFNRLLDDLIAGRPVKKGSQIGRVGSEPVPTVTTLTDPALYDGSLIGAWRARFEEEEAKARQAAADKAAADQAAAAKAAADRALAAETVANPKPGKPAADTAGIRAAETPASRVAQGKEPVAPRDRASAADPVRASSEKPTSALPEIGPGTPAGSTATPSVPADEARAETVSDAQRPVLLAAPQGGAPDDLELIWGVGPKLAAMLHGMGVFHFSQIAAWNEMNLRWVDQNLGTFKGRAIRDQWIAQARKLATGWRPEKATGDKPEG